MRWYDVRFWKWMLVATVVLIAAFTLNGCRSTKYVTVPEYHTEYVCRTDTVSRMDSVYMKDSVYVYRNGDTVMVCKTVYRDRWRNAYRVKLDTIIKRDSVNVPYPVQRELTRSERIAMRFWKYVFFILVIGEVVCMAIVAFYWYRNKKC